MPDPIHETIHELARIFAPEGPLAAAVEGFRSRPQQLEMAQRIAAGIASGRRTRSARWLACLCQAFKRAHHTGRFGGGSTGTRGCRVVVRVEQVEGKNGSQSGATSHSNASS